MAYSKEFKQTVLQFLNNVGSIPQAAEEYSIPESTIRTWVSDESLRAHLDEEDFDEVQVARLALSKAKDLMASISSFQSKESLERAAAAEKLITQYLKIAGRPDQIIEHTQGLTDEKYALFMESIGEGDTSPAPADSGKDVE